MLLAYPDKVGEHFDRGVGEVLGLDSLVDLAPKHEATTSVLNQKPVLLVRSGKQLRTQMGDLRLEQRDDLSTDTAQASQAEGRNRNTARRGWSK